ncbi:MAG TPA: permease-like cell division protein FtsX [Bacteroidia bacterium]
MSDEKRRRRISTSSAITVLSISLVLFLVGLLGIFLISAKKISDHLKENIGFHVYLKDNAKDEEIERLHNFLKASNYVKSNQYLSKDSAAAIYKKEVGDDFVQFIGYNPLPASMEVQLKADFANPDSIVWIQKQIMDFSAVKEFDYQESLVNLVNKNVNRIVLVLLIFIGLLMFIALGLINNTIRLAIYSKRYLIKTMQLVGATGGFIRKPFLTNGLQHGILAGIISCLMLWGMIFAAIKKIPDLEQVTDAQLMIYLFGMVIALGIIISGISTFFAVRKYLRLSSDKLYI